MSPKFRTDEFWIYDREDGRTEIYGILEPIAEEPAPEPEPEPEPTPEPIVLLGLESAADTRQQATSLDSFAFTAQSSYLANQIGIRVAAALDHFRELGEVDLELRP